MIFKLKLVRKFGLMPLISTKTSQLRKKSPGEHGKLFTNKTNRITMQDLSKSNVFEKQKCLAHFQLKSSELQKYSKLFNSTNHNFITKIIRRLDIFLTLVKLTPSILMARQLISHKHVVINNKILTFKAKELKVNDIIKIKYKLDNLFKTQNKFLTQISNTEYKINMLPTIYHLNFLLDEIKILSSLI